jgi:flagellar hook-basal body complex protein FliE
MDALSALKIATAPQAAVFSPHSANGVGSSLPQAIPSAELQQLSSANSDTPLQSSSAVSSTGGANFQDMLGGLVNDVAQKQAAASGAVTGLLSGQNVSLHQAMISMEEANVSFQMMVEVRNRLLDSYQELMRMQI